MVPTGAISHNALCVGPRVSYVCRGLLNCVVVVSLVGWDRANVRKDLQRMGLPTDKWRISDSNHSYLICPTYPSVFAVPSNVSDITLHKVSSLP